MAAAMYAVLAFGLGASIGSFLNVVADRFPNGRSIVRPGSFCGGTLNKCVNRRAV